MEKETTKQWLDRLKKKAEKERIKEILDDEMEDLDEIYFFQTLNEKYKKGVKDERN